MVISRPSHSRVEPAERAEANSRSSSTGNFRSARMPRMTPPTCPVAPTIPTLTVTPFGTYDAGAREAIMRSTPRALSNPLSEERTVS